MAITGWFLLSQLSGLSESLFILFNSHFSSHIWCGCMPYDFMKAYQGHFREMVLGGDMTAQRQLLHC